MSDDQASSYDELPYGDNCFPYTHPDHLAALGSLYGIDPPAVAHCRVLELGCAGGGNLIPMAAGLPAASFVGIDLSARQVAAGREIVNALGLSNIELVAMNLAEVDERFGTFDYVICHGVYSWVPEGVREKILDICAGRLAPGGVAYVSYNTYPGWHARGLARELMAYHVRRPSSALDRVREARGFLDELVGVLPDQSSAYTRILRTEGEFLHGVENSYLYHEHLEETNHPCYFHEFVGRAEARGLRFLAEARTPGLIGSLPPAAREALGRWAGDETATEQYLDFLCNRTFRRTLLCRAERGRLPTPSPERVSALWVGTNVRPASPEPDVAGDAPEEFRKPEGAASLTTNSPLVKAALVVLYEVRPRTLGFEALWDGVRSRLGLGDDEEARGALRAALLRCFLSNLVEFHTLPPRFAAQAGARPRASALARVQARAGGRVTNLRSRTLEPGGFDLVVLRLLDGRRDRAALLEALDALVASGEFTVHAGDEPVNDPAQIREALAAELEPCLGRLAGLALLEDDGADGGGTSPA